MTALEQPDLRQRIAQALAATDVHWGYHCGFSTAPDDDMTAACVAAVLAVVQPELTARSERNGILVAKVRQLQGTLDRSRQHAGRLYDLYARRQRQITAICQEARRWKQRAKAVEAEAHRLRAQLADARAENERLRTAWTSARQRAARSRDEYDSANLAYLESRSSLIKEASRAHERANTAAAENERLREQLDAVNLRRVRMNLQIFRHMLGDSTTQLTTLIHDIGRATGPLDRARREAADYRRRWESTVIEARRQAARADAAEQQLAAHPACYCYPHPYDHELACPLSTPSA